MIKIFRGLWTALVLSVSVSGTAQATDVTYDTPTSAPHGQAVCVFDGVVAHPQPGNMLDVSLSPSMGEASLTLALANGLVGFANAGTQAGCDIFSNTPTMFSLSLPGDGKPAKFLGILDIHAHPGVDCGAAGQGVGTVSAVVSGGLADPPVLKNLECDSDPNRANLGLVVDAPGEGATGEAFPIAVEIRNHGPGDAQGARLNAKLPRNAFLMGTKTTQGTCLSDGSSCDLGTIPSHQSAFVYFSLIPLKKGKLNTRFGVIAENNGELIDDKAKTSTPIMQGSSAILNVTVKCKGAGGTVTINPAGNGGMTTCTCPDNSQNPPRTTVQCVEIYSALTTVTLTEAPTAGQFGGWTGDCGGNQATCQVTLDPAATNPDKNVKAKFKP